MKPQTKLPILARKGPATNVRRGGAHRNPKTDITRAEKLRRALEND